MQAMQESFKSASVRDVEHDLRGAGDSEVTDWNALELPSTWPDELDFRKPQDFYRLIRHILGTRGRVELPAGVFGRERIPQYALQEFHRLPNGLYSHRMVLGYSRWFDPTMLYTTRRARRTIAELLRGRSSALDIGCADGKLAEAFVRAGIADVCGLDVSPYILKLGASLRPTIKFFHGTAERMPFADERFDAIGACFLFHELPPRHAHGALRECHRVLEARGRLVICEPAPEQLERGATFRIIRIGGLRAPYFQLLARFMFEPFVEHWHRQDYPAWFASAGFRLLEDRREFPCRYFVAEKAAS